MITLPTTCCSARRPLIRFASLKNPVSYRFSTRDSLLVSLYPPSHTMCDGEAAYPSNYKPIPLLETIEQSEKVLYDNSPAPESYSLRDTFDDQVSASTTAPTSNTCNDQKLSASSMPCAVSQERNSKPEVSVLPIGFSPHPYSVICGRGKVRTDTPGNRYLQSVAARYMQKYSQAQHSRKEKSSIVSNILQMVRDVCPDGRGAFIRTEQNRWFVLSELEARDKISSVMRNGLQSKYKSSTKSKGAKRRDHNKAMKKNDEEIRIEDGPLSPDMAFGDRCFKYELLDHSNTDDDEQAVFDLLSGEDLIMDGFFE